MDRNPLNTSLPARERFYEIDLFRGIACVLVVAFHYCYRGALDGWSPPMRIEVVSKVAQFGYLGVHLFFIISGFVIFLSAGSVTVAKFTASRISRLYPAFWVAVPLTWAVVKAFDVPSLEVSLPHMLINLSMVPHYFNVPFVDGAYWSLAVELQFYILVGLAIHFKAMHKAEWLLCGWLAIALVNAIRPMYPVEFWLAANWAPLFCLGACAYLIRTQGRSKRKMGIFISSYSLALYYALKKIAPTTMDHHSAVPALVVGGAITAFALIFALIAAGKLKLKPHPLVTMAGLLTYPLYLLHEFMGYVFISALDRRLASPESSVLIVFAGMVAASWLLNRGVEKPFAPILRTKIVARLPRAREPDVTAR